MEMMDLEQNLQRLENSAEKTAVSCGGGEMLYRHGSSVYEMSPGDSLYFDADAPHGPEELNQLPIRFLSFIVEPDGKS